MRLLEEALAFPTGATPPAAFAVLRLHGARAESAVRLAWHFTRDPEAALDISQEAFVKALESLAGLEDPSRLEAWFDRIVVNLSRDWLRRRGAERKVLRRMGAMSPSVAPDRAEAAEVREEHGRLCAALLDLPIELREAVVLVCVEGRAPKDAAFALGVPEGTLRWRLHEGRARLRRALGE